MLFLYPPGDPKIDSITPASGPANGGTPVTITGENLGCVTNVSFGSVAAVDATNAAALLDCGSTDTVTVTAPAGSVGHGSDHALDGGERRDRRTGRARVVHVHQGAVADPDRSEVGPGLREDHELAGGYQLPEDLLAQVRLRQLGDPEGESLQGLRLRRLVGRGRVHQEVDVQDQGHRGPRV